MARRPVTPESSDPLMTSGALADHFGVTPQAVTTWRDSGLTPDGTVSGRPAWRRSRAEQWVAENRIESGRGGKRDGAGRPAGGQASGRAAADARKKSLEADKLELELGERRRELVKSEEVRSGLAELMSAWHLALHGNPATLAGKIAALLALDGDRLAAVRSLLERDADELAERLIAEGQRVAERFGGDVRDAVESSGPVASAPGAGAA